MRGKRIRLFACESQPVVVEGLRCALDTGVEFEFVGSAETAGQALQVIAAHRPDVLLLDYEDGPAAAIGLLAELKKTGAAIRPVLWVRKLEEADRLHLLEAGVRGIVRKDRPIEMLLECLRSAGAGGLWIDELVAGTPARPEPRRPPHLTPREQQIVSLIGQGLKNNQIAQALSISPGTVKVHLMHVFEKTGVSDRFDLAMRSRKLLGRNEQP